jgi:PAS domain S-box-containing protein
MLDQVEAAVIGVDLEGRITYWNRFASLLGGLPAAEAIGHRLFDLLSESGRGHASLDPIEHATSGGSTDGEYVFRRRSGEDVVVQARLSPMRDASGTIVGAVAVCVDVSYRKRAERRTTTQYEVTRVLAESPSLAAATPLLLEALCMSLDLDLAVLWAVDPASDLLRCVDVWQRPGLKVTRFQEMTKSLTLDRGTGLPGRVWETGRSAWVSNIQQEASFPRRSVAAEDGFRGAFGFPIVLNREVLGIIETFTREVGKPDPGMMQLMSAIGSQVGQYIDRKSAEEAVKRSEAELSSLLERERTARAEAERAQHRLAILATASDLLSETLDYGETLKQVARLAVPGLADWCAIDVLEGGKILTVALAHADPSKVELAQRLARDSPQEPDASWGAPHVLRTGESQLYADLDEERLLASAMTDEHAQILRDLGLRSAMVLPLSARGRTFGAITFVSAESGRVYSEEDLSFARDLGRRAALAIDNARLYEERSHVARTLQNSLLPPRIPAIPGVEVAARYRAAGRGNEVGGDFFDVFETDGDEWALVIGDVCGKGVGAAAVTGLARHTLRAAAMREKHPSNVLGVLNEAILRADVEERFCTAIFVRLQGDNGIRKLELSSGGHPSPLLLRASGEVVSVSCPGMLIGLFDDAELHDCEITLESGDALVLYTDGVVEGQGSDIEANGLNSILESCVGLDAAAIGERIEQRVVASHDGDPADDIAVLVLRLP